MSYSLSLPTLDIQSWVFSTLMPHLSMLQRFYTSPQFTSVLKSVLIIVLCLVVFYLSLVRDLVRLFVSLFVFACSSLLDSTPVPAWTEVYVPEPVLALSPSPEPLLLMPAVKDVSPRLTNEVTPVINPVLVTPPPVQESARDLPESFTILEVCKSKVVFEMNGNVYRANRDSEVNVLTFQCKRVTSKRFMPIRFPNLAFGDDYQAVTDAIWQAFGV